MKRFLRLTMKFVGWPIIIGALAGLAFLAIFSLDDYFKRSRMATQAEIDATMYIGRMNAYMGACTSTGVNPKGCIGAWGSGGGN